MKKFIFIFTLLIGSISMFANEVVNRQDVNNELLEFEIPIKLDAPNGTYYLLSVVASEESMQVLDSLAEAVDSPLAILLPDVIELDVMGVPGGVLVLSTDADISLWEVSLNEIAFNAIVNGEEGATISAEGMIIPGILSINFVISAI